MPGWSLRNLSIWTTMIGGYEHNFCSNRALVLFDQMVAEVFEPNSLTMASVLSACARSGCSELGERIHAYMKVKGFDIGVILGTALVHMYAKNGAILAAQYLFESTCEKKGAILECDDLKFVLILAPGLQYILLV